MDPVPEEREEFLSDTSLGDNYGNGWRVMLSSFGILLAVTLIYAVIRAPLDSSSGDMHFGVLSFFALPYGLFVAGPIGMSVSWVFLKAVRGETIQISDMFSVFQRNYWNALAAGFLSALFIVIGLVLFIFPGILIACRLSFVSYLIIDRQMDAMQALRTSWHMTQGYGWTIFGMGFLAIFILIAGFLALIVGIFPAAMWISAAFAVLYHSVERKEGVPAVD